MFKPITREEYHKNLGDKKVFWKDDCPFCKIEENESSIIRKWTHWYLIHNISSYSWDHRHIMAVPFEHICFTNELKKEHFEELKDVHNAVKKFFGEDIYFSFTRESMANRSVEHLHMHFLAWKLQWKFLRKMLELQWFPITQELKLD